MVCLFYSKVSKVNNDFIFTKSGAVRENSALTRGVRKAMGFATPTPRKSSSEVLAGGGIMCLPERVRPLHFFKKSKDNRDNNDYKEINALFKDNIRGGLLPPCVVNLANRAAALPKQNPASVRGWLSRKSRYTYFSFNHNLFLCWSLREADFYCSHYIGARFVRIACQTGRGKTFWSSQLHCPQKQ